MPHYESLSPEIEKQISERAKSECYFENCNALRRDSNKDLPNAIRPAFIRDIDKIMHCPYYNRYSDKTQVFSFYKNDDITRRSLHVQLVSRIARTIGNALGLNLDLIEAIALGHDIGHTPFGHAGEYLLDEISFKNTNRHFSHNIHSVRVLDGIFPYNITLQTLNGIASHDGEIELSEYRPQALTNFDDFDKQIENCYLDKENVKKLVPCTLEGCVVRISDIIAYLGKDRQDAQRACIVNNSQFEDYGIGKINAEFINNLTVNIVENSFGKPYIKLGKAQFEALKQAKADNYNLIYKNEQVGAEIDKSIRPMMFRMYEKLLLDLEKENFDSPIFTHHIKYVESAHYERKAPYIETEKNQIVIDYIASMTDDYFIDLYEHLFPKSEYEIKYKGYFD